MQRMSLIILSGCLGLAGCDSVDLKSAGAVPRSVMPSSPVKAPQSVQGSKGGNAAPTDLGVTAMMNRLTGQTPPPAERKSGTLALSRAEANEARSRVFMNPSIARDIMRTPVTLKMLSAAAEAERGVASTDMSISNSDLQQLGLLLGTSRDGLIDQMIDASVAPTKAANGDRFARTWPIYLRAYTMKKLVTSRGEVMSRPSISEGVNNEAIAGLARVVLEAAFDSGPAAVPVFVKTKHGVTTLTPEYVVDPTLNDPNLKIVRYRETKADETSFLTEEGREPLGLAMENPVLERQDIVSDGDGITEKDLRVIRFVSDLAGEQASVLTGVLFGFLNDVNVGFVVGANFAVGDNETLSVLVRTISGVIARRSTERIAYQALDETYKNDDPGTRLALAAVKERLEKLAKTLDDIPDVAD